MQKKLLTLLIFNDGNAAADKPKALYEALLPFFDRTEIICHSLSRAMPEGITDLSVSDYGRFIKVAAGMAKGRYIAVIPPDATVSGEQFGALLKLIEKPCDNVIIFSGADCPTCAAIDTKLFRNLCQSASEAQLVNIPLHAYIAAKSYKKVKFKPFDCGGRYLARLAETYGESFKSSVIIAAKSFNAPRNRTSTLMYKSCFDALYACLEAAYIEAIRRVAKDKSYAVRAAEFDDAIKQADAKLYEYAERRLTFAPLKKLRQSRFEKIPLLTAIKLAIKR